MQSIQQLDFENKIDIFLGLSFIVTEVGNSRKYTLRANNFREKRPALCQDDAGRSVTDQVR